MTAFKMHLIVNNIIIILPTQQNLLTFKQVDKVIAHKIYKPVEEVIEQEGKYTGDNTILVTEWPIQGNKVNNIPKDNIAIKVYKIFKVFVVIVVTEAIIIINIDLTIYSIINLFTYTNKFNLNFINLSLFETLIVIEASEASKVNIVTKASAVLIVDLIINNITNLSIQNNNGLPNQIIVSRCQGT